MKRWLYVCVLYCAILGVPAFAIFGIGDVVFDPTNYAEAVRQLVQLEQQYKQLVQTYAMVRNQYEQFVWMAKQVPVDMNSRYRALATAWKPVSATNTYDTTNGWVSGINTGLDVAQGYARATQSLLGYGDALAQIPADQLDRIKTHYATVELADGANLHSIETIGRLRANAPFVERAIRNLEDDSLSRAPEMNTQIAVLNKINAAHLMSIRSSQNANQILVAMAEDQVIDAKRKRDAEAQAINNHIHFLKKGKQAMDAQSADASSAMSAWRMP